MRGLTYFDLAQRYEVGLCADSCGESGHRRGWVDDGIVHWDAHRSPQRSTLRRFLMLVWVATEGNRPRALSVAERVHAANVFAYRTALHDLGIRFPATLAEADKARVRYLLIGASAELRRGRVGRWAGLR